MSIAVRHALRRPLNALYALFLISRARHRTCMSAPVCTFSNEKKERRDASPFSHMICAVWFLVSTLSMMRSSMPFSSKMKVLRSVPIVTLP